MAVIGEDFTSLVPGSEATDAEESVRTLETFVRRCSYDDLSPQEFYYVLGFNTTVPPYVRAGLHSRKVTHDDTLADLDVPVLVTHGSSDRLAGDGRRCSGRIDRRRHQADSRDHPR